MPSGFWASLMAQQVKNPPKYRRHRLDSWVGKTSEGGHGNPFQYFSLKNLMDRGVWQAAVHGVAEWDTTSD